MGEFELNINHDLYSVSIDGDKPLLWVLRDELGLTGTKYGCGVGQCGACTVHVNGTPVRSCSLPIASVGRSEITTIEGLGNNLGHLVLKAWEEENVPQCGYCQAGQIMSAAALIANNPKPSEKEIEVAMNGNICRCGTYYRIRNAIQRAVRTFDENRGTD